MPEPEEEEVLTLWDLYDPEHEIDDEYDDNEFAEDACS
jgi:hypothetical protein